MFVGPGAGVRTAGHRAWSSHLRAGGHRRQQFLHERLIELRVSPEDLRCEVAGGAHRGLVAGDLDDDLVRQRHLVDEVGTRPDDDDFDLLRHEARRCQPRPEVRRQVVSIRLPLDLFAAAMEERDLPSDPVVDVTLGQPARALDQGRGRSGHHGIPTPHRPVPVVDDAGTVRRGLAHPQPQLTVEGRQQRPGCRLRGRRAGRWGARHSRQRSAGSRPPPRRRTPGGRRSG